MRFWGLIRSRLRTIFPSYRPERHYMRGPWAEMAGKAWSLWGLGTKSAVEGWSDFALEDH
jgi:hypothetical protein